MRKLKIDFHVHTGEDPKDRYIAYSAKQLLDRAAPHRFDAICIANSGRSCDSPVKSLAINNTGK